MYACIHISSIVTSVMIPEEWESVHIWNVCRCIGFISGHTRLSVVALAALSSVAWLGVGTLTSPEEVDDVRWKKYRHFITSVYFTTQITLMFVYTCVLFVIHVTTFLLCKYTPLPCFYCSSNMPLPETILIYVCDTIWCHQAAISPSSDAFCDLVSFSNILY